MIEPGGQEACLRSSCSARSQSCSACPSRWPRSAQYFWARRAISSWVGTRGVVLELDAVDLVDFVAVVFLAVAAVALGFAGAFAFFDLSVVSAICALISLVDSPPGEGTSSPEYGKCVRICGHGDSVGVRDA